MSKTKNQQPTILQLARAGFDEAKRLLRWHRGLECALIVSAIVALWHDGPLAYWLSLVALGLQVLGWIARHQGLSMHSLAERAKRQAMLANALGSVQGGAQHAELRSEFSPKVTRAAKAVDADTYYFSVEPHGKARLRDHLLESSFWSKDLYAKAGARALKVVGVLTAAIVAAIFTSVPEASGDTRLLLARVLVLLLGSAVTFELLDAGLTWLGAAKDTSRVFHESEHVDLDRRHDVLGLFGDYAAATTGAPPIPDGVYKGREEHLNQIWSSYRRRVGRG